jgi:hypothetical protein
VAEQTREPQVASPSACLVLCVAMKPEPSASQPLASGHWQEVTGRQPLGISLKRRSQRLCALWRARASVSSALARRLTCAPAQHSQNQRHVL